VARKLIFPADPITSVQECWHFEHRGHNRTLLKQVELMGLSCLQVEHLAKSPLYDMGFWYRNAEAKKLAQFNDRMTEHNRIFNTFESTVIVT
jgi:hypothetical protein